MGEEAQVLITQNLFSRCKNKEVGQTADVPISSVLIMKETLSFHQIFPENILQEYFAT